MLFFSQNKNILLNDKKQTHKTIQYLSELYNEILDSNNYAKKNINYTMSVKKIQSSLKIKKNKNFLL